MGDFGCDYFVFVNNDFVCDWVYDVLVIDVVVNCGGKLDFDLFILVNYFFCDFLMGFIVVYCDYNVLGDISKFMC